MSSHRNWTTCLKCTVHKPRDAYTAYQWSLGHMAKCSTCVFGGDFGGENKPQLPPANSRGIGRSATAANMHAPLECGPHNWVTVGTSDSGRACIVKWPRQPRRTFEHEGLHEAHYERSLSDVKVRILNRALPLVASFNATAGAAAGVHVLVNVPSTFRVRADDERMRYCWQTQRDGPTRASEWEGQQVQVEPFLASFQKWGSNSGWVAEQAPAWAAILGHYSFHASGGCCLLCDLKGSVDAEEGTATISDPCIHSRGRSFGPSDLGTVGINTWFVRHTCTEVCRKWLRPPYATTATLPLKRETAIELPQALPPSVLVPPLRAGNRQAPLPAATLAEQLDGTVLASMRPVFVVDSRADD